MESSVPAARPVRLHIVHESRMLAETMAVRLRVLVPRASVDGWTNSWATYANHLGDTAHVVVLSADLKDGHPVAAKVARLREDGVRAVVVGSSMQASVIERAYAAGASSFVHLTEPSDTLARAVTAAIEDRVHHTLAVSALLLASDHAAVPALTVRELEVAGAYVDGESVPAVAARLGLAVETVRSHLARTRRKYGELGAPGLSKLQLRQRMARDGWIVG
jgi:DNA-binding NarL/FixJ family response regulator